MDPQNYIFRVLIEASVWMCINRRPWLSPTFYNSLWRFVDFKADMHNVYIKAGKDPAQNGTKVPFIAIDDAIFSMLESCPLEWHTLDLVEQDKIMAQK